MENQRTEIISTENKSPEMMPQSYENRALAKMQLAQNGITDDQRKAYIPGVSELANRVIIPRGDWANQNLIKYLVVKKDISNAREDAWKMFLGFPQKYNTFGISDYYPSKSKEDKYYYKLNHFIQRFKQRYTFSDMQLIEYILSSISINYLHLETIGKNETNRTFLHDDITDVMGHFMLSKNQDQKGCYVSYYDRWDLHGPFTRIIGKPFELYDRIYYNPQTFEIIANPHIPQERVNQTK